jgi:HPt (histidine-containing phosphotransfer) domain-containing protein
VYLLSQQPVREEGEMPQDDSIESIRNYLKTEFELDDADIKEMLTDYLANVERLLGVCASSMEKSDMDTLHKAGHSIKGVAGNVGSNSISASGKFIEDNARPGVDAGLFQESIQSIRRQYDALKSQKDAAK